jgi:hypothetical protein
MNSTVPRVAFQFSPLYLLPTVISKYRSIQQTIFSISSTHTYTYIVSKHLPEVECRTADNKNVQIRRRLIFAPSPYLFSTPRTLIKG